MSVNLIAEAGCRLGSMSSRMGLLVLGYMAPSSKAFRDGTGGGGGRRRRQPIIRQPYPEEDDSDDMAAVAACLELIGIFD